MPAIAINNLDLYYGSFQALKGITSFFKEKTITALIGPSGCGKSTLLRCLNRMNDLIDGIRIEGQVLIGDKDIYAPGTDLIQLRKEVGMVFQRPNPFPLSILENVIFGLKIHGQLPSEKKKWEKIAFRALSAVGLWETLKDRLKESALSLTLEQQQRVCIARIVALQSRIVLMDEPCSALDPMATEKIESLMLNLKENFTIVIVTHNMQQAARISEETGFMLLGDLIEFGPTGQIFTKPQDDRTNDYITGRYG
ncbi:MAG: phosphate ABC transporter ATP-binding protein [Deltaproteobacteria bacterium RBG_13_43_22]|nr:MAG: phosphate ABC transporter ATP-binding protein [Deltaproteobacteria bacterium RBG_13_43_22]